MLAALALGNASKSIDGGASYAIRDVALELRQDTLLKTINRLVEPDEGYGWTDSDARNHLQGGSPAR